MGKGGVGTIARDPAFGFLAVFSNGLDIDLG